MKKTGQHLLSSILLWVRYLGLIAVGCFFAFFGLQVLLLAYQLDDPFSFIITFFASNLIILISGALVVGFVFRLRQAVAHRHTREEQPQTDRTD